MITKKAHRRQAEMLLALCEGSQAPITAADFAEWHDVALRTIYRDFAELREAGIPVVGEPGSGYVLQRRVALPGGLRFDDALALELALLRAPIAVEQRERIREGVGVFETHPALSLALRRRAQEARSARGFAEADIERECAEVGIAVATPR